MVIYYDEADLASFGNYMISKARKKSITENPEITNAPTRKALLGAVTNFDIGNWHRLRVEAERKLEEEDNINVTENVMEDLGQEVPEDSENTVQMYPKTND